jgi:hypothetical protein
MPMTPLSPVPVPKRQGLPSFAQSEFYTVDMIFVHPPAGSWLAHLLFVVCFCVSSSSLFLYIDRSPSTVLSGAATASG